MRNYNQLTQTERYQIYALRKANKNPKEISRVLGRHMYHLPGIEAQSWETRPGEAIVHRPGKQCRLEHR